MDFIKYETKTPTKVGSLRIILENDTVLYYVDLVDDDDNLVSKEAGDLLPYLTLTQQTSIQKFMSDIILKAEKLI